MSISRSLRHFSIQSKSLTVSAATRPQLRPWRFSDFFIPTRAWDYRPRPDWDQHRNFELIGCETWGNLSDEELPEPWSCDWGKWGMSWNGSTTSNLKYRFGLEAQKPLAFRCTRSDNHSTVFLGIEKHLKKPKFYLYDAPSQDVFRFEQVLDDTRSIGAAEWVQTADWNKMTHLGYLPRSWEKEDPDTVRPTRHRYISGPPLFLADMHDGPWAAEPREKRDRDVIRALESNPTMRDWCFIPDSELPEPWSCQWVHSYCSGSKTVLLESGGVFYLYDEPDCDDLYDFYKEHLAPFPPTVSRTAAAVYRSISHPPGVPEHLLYKFDGVYSSVADFIERADWMKMSLMVPGPESSEPRSETPGPEQESVKLPLTDDGGPLRIAVNTH
ncbi:hypothetical protein B0H11DRAFT_2135399 [Mycena galericulata]|nr:hypothetical protein B0H11DRAFT_2135399 [Mycena galericulata]